MASFAEIMVLAILGELRKQMVGLSLGCSCFASEGLISMSGEAVKAFLRIGKSVEVLGEKRILKTVLVLMEFCFGVRATLLRSK